MNVNRLFIIIITFLRSIWRAVWFNWLVWSDTSITRQYSSKTHQTHDNIRVKHIKHATILSWPIECVVSDLGYSDWNWNVNLFTMSGYCFQLIDAGILLLFFIYFYSLFLFSISILYFYPILMNCNVVRWLVINGDQKPQKLQKHTYKLNVYVFNILHHNHANSIVRYLFLVLFLVLFLFPFLYFYFTSISVSIF